MLGRVPLLMENTCRYDGVGECVHSYVPYPHHLFVSSSCLHSQVSAGRDHNCAIKGDGSISCWGSNEWGECDAPAGHQFVQISAGHWHHTCGIDTMGKALCWGADGFGESSSAPQEMSFLQVSSGRKYSCGIIANTSVVCWGLHDQYHVSKAPSDLQFTQVTAGFQHACGVLLNNSAVCWGQDVGGQSSVPATFIPAA